MLNLFVLDATAIGFSGVASKCPYLFEFVGITTDESKERQYAYLSITCKETPVPQSTTTSPKPKSTTHKPTPFCWPVVAKDKYGKRLQKK